MFFIDTKNAMALVFIYTTVGSQKDAQQLAELLVKQQLAACVSVGACVQSHFVWQGKREWAEEYPLTIKTTVENQQLVCDFIRSHHPYFLPEIVCMPVSYAYGEYQQWVEKNVSGCLK
ncbi:MAG: divalent-cation tolerance protein CutA [Neisseriaceae bacterium]|nr:divalent-cation tolerance protein CutA [Neisseriaceae bacterium]